jgi:hypothetical protein
MEKLKCKIGKGTIEVMGVKVNTFVDLEFVRNTDNKVAFMSKKGEMIITSMQLFRRWTSNIVVAQQFIDRGVWDIVPDEDVTFDTEPSVKESPEVEIESPQYETPDFSQISIDVDGNMIEENSQSFPESELDEKVGELSNLDLRQAIMNVLFAFLLLFLYLYQINNYEDLQYWQFISVFIALVLGNIYLIKQKRKLRG